MSNWKPFRGQISFLNQVQLGAPPSPSILKLFEFVWTEQPQSFQQGTNPLAPSVATASGNGTIRTCSAIANRIDISITPEARQAPNNPITLNLIEDPEDFWNRLQHVVDALAQDSALIPEVFDRAAISAQLLSVERSTEDVNRALLGVIPEEYRVPLTDEDGFIFQVVQSQDVHGVPRMKAAFARKWGAELVQMVNFGGLQQNPIISNQFPLTPQITKFKCASVSAEFNSGQSEGTLPKGARQAVLRQGLQVLKNAFQHIDLM